MKIVQLKTNMAVKAGSPKGETHFTTDAHSMHKGLSMTPYVHPELGHGVMIETDALRKKNQVSFVSINNIEETTFAKDEATPIKAKK